MSRGDEAKAAVLLSNFLSQRTVQPFIFTSNNEPVARFGKNIRDTILAAKKSSSGTRLLPVEKLLRSAIASGARGPLSRQEVCIMCC